MRSWIKVARTSFKLRNFMTTVEILTALSIGPIFRLKTSKRVFAHPKFQKMQLAMSYKGNYASYRKILRKCPGAAFVPYFGLIFKDVYGLEGSKPSIKTKDEATKVTKVLFEKCLKISSYINEVCEHKRNQYDSSNPIHPVSPNFKLRSFFEETVLAAVNLDGLFDLSYKIQPRGERRARSASPS